MARLNGESHEDMVYTGRKAVEMSVGLCSRYVGRVVARILL